MSKKNRREAKARRRAEREEKPLAEVPPSVSAALVPHVHGAGETCPKCGKPRHDRDAVIHFHECVSEFPRDFDSEYEVVYERTMFKHTHRWVLPRTASDAEKDALRAKLTEKYRRKPRQGSTPSPA